MLDIVRERLELICNHAEVIERRTASLSGADDLSAEEEDSLLYDALLTRLQALGENVKKVDKLAPHIFRDKMGVDPTPIVRFRDIVSHHYDYLNHESVFQICKEHVPALRQAVVNYLKNSSEV